LPITSASLLPLPPGPVEQAATSSVIPASVAVRRQMMSDGSCIRIVWGSAENHARDCFRCQRPGSEPESLGLQPDSLKGRFSSGSAIRNAGCQHQSSGDAWVESACRQLSDAVVHTGFRRALRLGVASVSFRGGAVSDSSKPQRPLWANAFLRSPKLNGCRQSEAALGPRLRFISPYKMYGAGVQLLTLSGGGNDIAGTRDFPKFSTMTARPRRASATATALRSSTRSSWRSSRPAAA
jgi:hypothetical protein